MSATGLKVFDKTLQETNHWLKITTGELGTDDRKMAFGTLRGALHAIRDRIGVDNAAHLGVRSYRSSCAASTTRAGTRRQHQRASATW